MSEATPKKPAAKKAKPARKRTTRSKPAPAENAGASQPVEVEAATSPAPASRPKALFSIEFEVRWRDLDAFNHVNNSAFLTYLEEARLRWLESLDGPWLTETTAPVLASAELQFRRPIPWPESLRIELNAERIGQSSLTLGHRILSARETGVCYCEGRAVMVWVDAASGKGASLPEAVRRAANAASGEAA